MMVGIARKKSLMTENNLAMAKASELQRRAVNLAAVGTTT